MKTCKCGFNYKSNDNLEMVNLSQTEGVIKYYCPNCKNLRFVKNTNTNDSSKISITYLDTVYENKKDVLWYGGDVVEITYKKMRLYLCANGDVRGAIYKDGEELITFKDKSNKGNFSYIIDSYLPEVNSDTALKEILSLDIIFEEEIKEKQLTAIILDNNNWWEAFVEIDGHFIDSFTIDVSDNLDESIEYIKTNIEDIYSGFLEEIE